MHDYDEYSEVLVENIMREEILDITNYVSTTTHIRHRRSLLENYLKYYFQRKQEKEREDAKKEEENQFLLQTQI